MTSDEAAFCDYINRDLQNRGLDARFNYVKRKGAGFDFDLDENVSDEMCLNVFDNLTLAGWKRFIQGRN
jgi:hypothetical protein